MTLRLLFSGLIFILCTALPAIAEDSEAQARWLINSLGCKACHSFEQSGSSLAPSLDRIGTRLNLQQLQKKLTSPQNNKKTFMPSYVTTPQEELNAILQFLADRK